MENNSKKMWVILGVVAVVLIIVIVAVTQMKKPATQNTNVGAGQDMTEAPDATTNPTPEATTPEEEAAAEAARKLEENKVYDLTNAKAEIPGASLVTADKKVVTAEGKAAKNDAIPNSADAPKPVLIAKEALPEQAVKLSIGDGKITPNSFTVKSGAPVSLAVSSTDGQVHVFIFTDAAVGAIAMGIGGGETKAITFNAPAPGNYNFRCDVPGHAAKGETGVMVVK